MEQWACMWIIGDENQEINTVRTHSMSDVCSTIKKGSSGMTTRIRIQDGYHV